MCTTELQCLQYLESVALRYDSALTTLETYQADVDNVIGQVSYTAHSFYLLLIILIAYLYLSLMWNVLKWFLR